MSENRGTEGGGFALGVRCGWAHVGKGGAQGAVELAQHSVFDVNSSAHHLVLTSSRLSQALHQTLPP